MSSSLSDGKDPGSVNPGLVKIVDGIPLRSKTKLLLYFGKTTYLKFRGYDKHDWSISCFASDGHNSTMIMAWNNTEWLFESATNHGEWEPRNWKNISRKMQLANQTEAFCYCTLCKSDPFCGNQARTDFAKVSGNSFWSEVMEEMKELHTVCSIHNS